MKKGVTYTYTVKASDYKDATATYIPSGDDENVSIDVKMVSSIDPADVETVNAIKEKFDKEVGTLRPDFASCKNICDLVKTKIEALGMDTTGVTVSVKSSVTQTPLQQMELFITMHRHRIHLQQSIPKI